MLLVGCLAVCTVMAPSCFTLDLLNLTMMSQCKPDPEFTAHVNSFSLKPWSAYWMLQVSSVAVVLLEILAYLAYFSKRRYN